MKILLIAISLTFCQFRLHAIDLTTLDGSTYKDVSIIKQTPSGVEILHERGGTYLPFAKLSKEIQQKYNYDREADLKHQQLNDARKKAKLVKLNNRLNASDLTKGVVNELEYIKTTYFVYIPESAVIDETQGLPLTVIVHGTGRDARSYIASFIDEAEKYKTALIAPLFDETQFMHYQFIYYEGLDWKNEVRGRIRSDLRLNDILDDLKRNEPFFNTRRFSIYGFSGGGQFTMRYSLLYPQKVDKAVVASPGSYLFPDNSEEFPRGTKYTSGYPLPNYPAFLKLNVLFCIGANDTRSLGGLKSTFDYDFQGKNRYIRHLRYKNAIKQYAASKNIDSKTKFHVHTEAGHQRIPFHTTVSEFLFEDKASSKPHAAR